MINVIQFTHSQLNDLASADEIFVFLGGIHGVGKTSFGADVFRKLGFYCVSASDLIGVAKQKNHERKRVTDVSGNQVSLIRRVNQVKHEHKKLLVDGHYCLVNEIGRIETVDPHVFNQMQPNLLLLLMDSPHQINFRLRSRDKEKWDIAFIRKFQKNEQDHAYYISKLLDIPLKIIDGNEWNLEGGS